MVLVMNQTRRIAIFALFVPLIAMYLIYTYKLHELVPTMATWPTQQQIATEFRAVLRHRLWPWTVSYDSKAEAKAEAEAEAEEKEEEEVEVAPHRVPFTRHIVAVGDLHGDLPNARRVLQFSGVADEFGDWTGDVDFFVQTGDIIDRGDDTIPLFVWMERLRSQASNVGGTVLSTLGNHEWMNAIGDWRYVYPTEIRTFGSVPARQKMITTGRIGRAWANNYTTATRLPLHPSIGPPNTPYPSRTSVQFQKEDDDLQLSLFEDVLDPLSHAALSFVHGGLSPTYSGLSPFPARINDLSASLLGKLQSREPPPPHPPNKYPGLPSSATADEIELYSSNGPLWYRGWAMEDEKKVCAQVDKVLKKTGTRRMIMGHTPDFTNIVARCGGKIIIIDTGISHAYGGVLSALSIHYTLTPIGKANEERWREREIVTAVYQDRREVLATHERDVVGYFDHRDRS